MPDELTSDSDDSRKMCQVENSATKKRKLYFQGNLCQRFHLLLSFTSPNQEMWHSHTRNQFRNTPLWSQRQGWNLLQPNNFGQFQNSTDHCYNHGELGDWKHSCPKKNIIQQIKGQPQHDGQNWRRYKISILIYLTGCVLTKQTRKITLQTRLLHQWLRQATKYLSLTHHKKLILKITNQLSETVIL